MKHIKLNPLDGLNGQLGVAEELMNLEDKQVIQKADRDGGGKLKAGFSGKI